jgi:hypothetical protein
MTYQVVMAEHEFANATFPEIDSFIHGVAAVPAGRGAFQRGNETLSRTMRNTTGRGGFGCFAISEARKARMLGGTCASEKNVGG